MRPHNCDHRSSQVATDEIRRAVIQGEDTSSSGLDLLPEDYVEPSEAYWLLATLGEACVILGNLEAAAKYYGRAVNCAPQDYVKLSSSQVLLLGHSCQVILVMFG